MHLTDNVPEFSNFFFSRNYFSTGARSCLDNFSPTNHPVKENTVKHFPVSQRLANGRQRTHGDDLEFTCGAFLWSPVYGSNPRSRVEFVVHRIRTIPRVYEPFGSWLWLSDRKLWCSELFLLFLTVNETQRLKNSRYEVLFFQRRYDIKTLSSDITLRLVSIIMTSLSKRKRLISEEINTMND